MSQKEQKEKLRRETSVRQCKLKLNMLEAFLNSFTVDQIEILRMNLDSCEPCLKEVEENLLELEFLDSSEENKARIDNELTNFSQQYRLLISKAKALLPKLTSTSVSQAFNNFSPSESSIRLPTLSLPSFSGTYETWAEFRDTFYFLVHNNHNLTDIQKFHYLKSCLKNAASKVIQSLEASEENYKVAWELLKNRYENLSLSVNIHIKAIFDIPVIFKENYSYLRNMTDILLKSIRCLDSLKIPVHQWDAILIYVITAKLDATTKRDWGTMHPINKLPTLDELIKFLTQRANLLESIQNKDVNDSSAKRNKDKVNSFASTENIHYKCYICHKNHSVFYCEDFKKLSVAQRIETVKQKNLCINCLRLGHTSYDCKGKTCQKCHKKHHTLLHREGIFKQTVSSNVIGDCDVNTNNIIVSCASQVGATSKSQTLLSTACVKVLGKTENILVLRALLDNGSQSNFITKNACEFLKLKTRKIQSRVNGLGAKETKIHSVVTLTIHSLYSNYEQRIECLVLDKITDNIPITPIDLKTLKLPTGIQLADVNFHRSKAIDLLLGSSVFWAILRTGKFHLGKGMPVLQRTHLGFILGGCIAGKEDLRTHSFCALSDQLTRFWDQEEVSEVNTNSALENECEQIFIKTTTKANDGRFVVDIPFNQHKTELGESRSCALRRFMSVEKRLEHHQKLAVQYKDFMTEYQALGHMTEIKETEESRKQGYYLPHHAVLKESSTTTKLRTVFDGSAATSSGLSLNDVQLKGPVVQSELFDILLRFRKYNCVFSADIEKMYRQILINPKDRKYQRILWRNNDKEPVKCFELNTITYGFTSSPFLATRCLKQLAFENQSDFPEACRVINEDFYIDDLLSGTNSIEEAKILKKDITDIMEKAKLNLRKWISNKNELLEAENSEPNTFKVISLDSNESNKTLGLFWQPHQDYLHYTTTRCRKDNNVTKREVLSVISKIYDPLNLLGPIHIRAKLFMQALWKKHMNWDDYLEDDL